LATGERRTVVERGTLPLYVDRGQLAYFRDGQMFAVPFDAAALKVTGSASPLLEAIPTLTAFFGEVPLLDVSRSGTTIYSANTAFSTLMWVSRKGEEQVLNGERRSYANPRMSPDGRRFIVQAGDLWMEDLERATFSRVTTGTILGNGFPIWMTDGRVMYRSPTGLRIQGTSGPGGDAQVIPGTTDLDYPGAVAPDGDTLVFLRSTEESSFNILSLSVRNPAKTSTILQTPAYEGGARLSPDGRWISYASNESGRNEIYLRPFPGPGERVQVSTDGGTQAIWNPNGKEIFYRMDDKMMAVDVTTSPTLKLSAPKLLFEARYAYGAGLTIPNFDVSRDGQRFVMVKPESGAGRLNVVLNWFASRAQAP
jgi:serine/threonine-protein kinase